MSLSWSLYLRTAVLTTAILFLGWNTGRSLRAQTAAPSGSGMGYGQRSPTAAASGKASGGQAGTTSGMGATTPVLTPGLFEVVCPAGCYGGAFHYFGCRAYSGPGYYGFFHRYWAYGTYGPNYYYGPGALQRGMDGGDLYMAVRRGHGLFKHGGAAYAPVAYAADEAGVLPVGGETNPPAPPAEGPARRPSEKLPSPTPKTAHLQILVPENAEVLVEGRKTTTTGTIRDFISPPLDPGKNLTYSITVRYPDAGGRTVEETHSIRVRANDQLRIDCIKPATTEPSHE
ncbi:MAG TPA: TIGR03000 domain-containing protein [Gemmataceae bacterium]|nr:TIGR03000 domain-containing protein [Gemmataceae bacterium]